MIYCPQCGTSNKPNSKFCKNCGALLAPSTDVRCPICGTLNPHSAVNCSSCGTRLATNPVGAIKFDQTTPADAPENIAPFHPPEVGSAETSAVEKPDATTRPTFSGSSTEWLRRIKKTPPSEPPPPTESLVTAQVADTAPTLPSVPSESEETEPEWQRELQPKVQAQAAETNTIAADAVATASKPELSEIRLTDDKYDYSDIGGQVTDEMKVQLEAQAGSLDSVEDEVALARRLLGLEFASESASPPPVSQVPPLATETSPPVPDQPFLSESVMETSGSAPAQLEAQAARDKDPNWIAALAAASSAAVAAEAGRVDAEHKAEETTAELPAPTLHQQQRSSEQAPSSQVPEERPIQAETAEPPALEARTEELVATSPAPENMPTVDADQVPEWLSELSPPAELSADAVAEAGQPPEQVQDFASGAAVAGAGTLLSQLPELDEQEKDDLPDWLREPLAPSVAETSAETSEPAGQEPTTAGRDTPVELPEWLAWAASAPMPPEVVEATGPLAGIRGILPMAVAITEPHTLTPLAPTRTNGGRVFQSLLTEPLVPAAPPRAQAQTKRLLTINHLLYLLIFLTALIPLYFPFEQAGLGFDVTKTPTADFFDQLKAIPPGSAVLLAFDYAPGQAVELNPAARAIVNDLVARKADVIAVSSNPNGVALAQSILSRAQETNPQFSFVNVGYIPGEQAGLNALARVWLPANRSLVDGTLWGASPLAGKIHGMDDLAQLILITGDDASLRMWMEQVQPNTKSPVIAATSAVLDPQARNYVNANQLRASLRGLTGAAELELLSKEITQTFTGEAVKTVDALSFVSLLLAGIIIATNVVGLFNRRKQEPK